MTKRREDREKRNESNPVLLPECEWPDELRWDAVACPWTYQNYEVQPPFPRAGAVFDAGLPVALFSVGTEQLSGCHDYTRCLWISCGMKISSRPRSGFSFPRFL